MNFCSDNVAGVAPEILAAIGRANEGTMSSYGGDEITARVETRLADIFERQVWAFPVSTGTAANALALAVIAGLWLSLWLAPGIASFTTWRRLRSAAAGDVRQPARP